jgi:hypothetical protein
LPRHTQDGSPEGKPLTRLEGSELRQSCSTEVPGRGSAARPPPPVVAPPTSWLRTPSRGDPPLKLSPVRGGLPVWQGGDRPQQMNGWGLTVRSQVVGQPQSTRLSPLTRTSQLVTRAVATAPYREPAPYGRQVKRGVAAGRSAQRACSRSNDWRRGAAGSPDPERLLGRRLLIQKIPV